MQQTRQEWDAVRVLSWSDAHASTTPLRLRHTIITQNPARFEPLESERKQ